MNCVYHKALHEAESGQLADKRMQGSFALWLLFTPHLFAADRGADPAETVIELLREVFMRSLVARLLAGTNIYQTRAGKHTNGNRTHRSLTDGRSCSQCHVC